MCTVAVAVFAAPGRARFCPQIHLRPAIRGGTDAVSICPMVAHKSMLFLARAKPANEWTGHSHINSGLFNGDRGSVRGVVRACFGDGVGVESGLRCGMLHGCSRKEFGDIFRLEESKY